MTDEGCRAMRLLVQADVDGELSPADAARVAVHLDTCPDCAALSSDLTALSARLRHDAHRYAAPDALRAAVRARIASELSTSPLPIPAAGERYLWRWPRWRPGNGAAFGFGTGFALAACLALAFVLPRQTGQTGPADAGPADAVVADHIRALQPGHLMDVVSTDQHTVKPWFDGRLDFAPPVKDLAADGLPLAGGRLDYLEGRTVAVLIYRSRQHVIELFVWPSGSGPERGPAQGSRSGYNFMRWRSDGMTFWAVSDLSASGLADFVRLWRSAA